MSIVRGRIDGSDFVTDHLKLAENQVWVPWNGKRSRRIDAVRVAALGDGYAMGTIFVSWMNPATGEGWRCSEKAFRRWVTYYAAVLTTDDHEAHKNWALDDEPV
jgi:hypothetical protein